MTISNPAFAPDTRVFQTCMPHPDRLLPESEPGTLANVLVRAAQGGR